MIATLTRNAYESDESYAEVFPEYDILYDFDYLKVDETIPSAEDIEAAFEEDESLYPCCNCRGCFYCVGE